MLGFCSAFPTLISALYMHLILLSLEYVNCLKMSKTLYSYHRAPSKGISMPHNVALQCPMHTHTIQRPQRYSMPYNVQGILIPSRAAQRYEYALQCPIHTNTIGRHPRYMYALQCPRHTVLIPSSVTQRYKYASQCPAFLIPLYIPMSYG